MAHVKIADIEMMEESGTYQLAVGESCVTEGHHKTADACYKAYIAELLNSIEKTRRALTYNTGF